ncbi:MAG: hypothetical protein ACLP1X_05730 [Polyangiaceae bacterium]
MSLDLDSLICERIAAAVRAAAVELQRPELVSQKTVLAVIGMNRRDYLDHCRAGDWPSYADRRFRYSRTVDVVAWLQAHPVAPRRTAANDSASEEARAFARYGARRVAE